MKTKTMVTLAVLVGIGAVLHTVIPGIFLGMKPDMMLTMIFLGIIFFPDKKNALLLGALAAVIAALTTSFPNGQLPSVVDKFITTIIFYFLVKLTQPLLKKAPVIKFSILTFIGTIVSGSLFLGSALLLSSLPKSFLIFFVTLVLPTAIINAIIFGVLYPIVGTIGRRTKLIENI